MNLNTLFFEHNSTIILHWSKRHAFFKYQGPSTMWKNLVEENGTQTSSIYVAVKIEKPDFLRSWFWPWAVLRI